MIRRLLALSALATLLVTGLPTGGQGAFTDAEFNGANEMFAGGWKPYTWTVGNDPVPTNWWRLDDGAGSSTAAPAVGAVTGSWENGHGTAYGAIVPITSNTAATFDAANQQCLSLGDRFDFTGRTPFSVELWFYRKRADAGAVRLISKSWYTDETWATGWELAIHGTDAGENANSLYFARFGTGANYTGSGGPTALNTWYHVVATYDGTTMAFYLNGVLSGTTVSTRDIVDSSRATLVGCRGLGNSGTGRSNWYTGAIDELSIYSTALTQRQVRARYFTGLGGH